MEFQLPKVNCRYVSGTGTCNTDQCKVEAKTLLLRDGEAAAAVDPVAPADESSNEAAVAPKETAGAGESGGEIDQDSDDEFVYQWRRRE